jgi:hypothetical protein
MSEGPREFWMHYDYQGAGQWCIESSPPQVIRPDAEVIHVREVLAASPSPTGMSEELVKRLHDHLKLKYVGDCKCDVPCQLVPASLISEAAATIERLTRRTKALEAELAKVHLSGEAEAAMHALDRAEAAEAELAKAREALEQIEDLPGYASMETVQAIAHAALKATP